MKNSTTFIFADRLQNCIRWMPTYYWLGPVLDTKHAWYSTDFTYYSSFSYKQTDSISYPQTSRRLCVISLMKSDQRTYAIYM